MKFFRKLFSKKSWFDNLTEKRYQKICNEVELAYEGKGPWPETPKTWFDRLTEKRFQKICKETEEKFSEIEKIEAVKNK